MAGAEKIENEKVHTKELDLQMLTRALMNYTKNFNNINKSNNNKSNNNKNNEIKNINNNNKK